MQTRSLLAVLAVVVVSASAALPLLQAGSCPTGGSPITSSLTLTSNCNYTGTNGIVLGANGITLDCNGYSVTLTALGSYYGISNQEGSAVTGDTVKNCNLSGWPSGMEFEEMSGLTLKKNTVTEVSTGIGIEMSHVGPATVSGNTVQNYETGFSCEYCSSITLTGNTATLTTPSGGDGVFFEYSFNLQIVGNTVTGYSTTTPVTGIGFWLEDSGLYPLTSGFGSGGSLWGNKANGNYNGFELDSASGFTLSMNTANNNGNYGFLDDSTGAGTLGLGNTYFGNTCTGNTAYGSYDGVAGFGPAWLCTPQG